MYCLIYKFPYPKSKLKEYFEIDNKSDKIYKEYGLVSKIKVPYLIRDLEKGKVEMMLISFYTSRKDYKKKEKALDKDDRIKKLYGSVLEHVSEKDIEVLEYETKI